MLKKILFLIFLIISISLSYYFYNFIYLNNYATVLDKQIYRSAQPTAVNIKNWQEQYHIKSILNLRGEGFSKSNKTARAVSTYADSNDIIINYSELSAKTLPPPKQFNQLINTIQNAPKPMLIHCKNGVDRTSFISAVSLLLEDYSIDRALQEFSIARGFLPFREQEILKTPIYDYKNWLLQSGLSTNKENFIKWAKNNYIPNYYKADFEILNLPEKLKLDEQYIVKVKVTNKSKHSIPFTTNNESGVTLMGCYHKQEILPQGCLYAVSRYPWMPDEYQNSLAFAYNSQEIDHKLAPNQSITLDFIIYKNIQKGKYILEFDLAEKNRFIFSDYGNTIVQQEFEVM